MYSIIVPTHHQYSSRYHSCMNISVVLEPTLLIPKWLKMQAQTCNKYKCNPAYSLAIIMQMLEVTWYFVSTQQIHYLKYLRQNFGQNWFI